VTIDYDNYSLGPFDERVEGLLSEAKAALLRCWNELHAEPPEVLWHYTAADGFRSILTHGTLRFSHSQLMNDATEHAFGWSRVTEVLSNEAARGDRLDQFFGMTREVGSEVHGNYHYFIFCLSERDDSLSQWRAYGSAGAGYSIGFKARELREPPKHGEFFFLKLIYDSKCQTALIDDAIGKIRHFFGKLFSGPIPDSDKLGILHRANVLLAQHLMRLALLFKHPSFEDEGEWRLIVGYSEQSGSEDVAMLEKVQFRSGGGLVRPFIDFNFASEEVDGRLVLPVKALMYGPTLRPTSTAFSVRFFLARSGYGHVEPEKSKVPLEP
jgi:hypothetical protein